ncbi:hypothetical protein BJV82DRAFT_94164 [Fennellomyces sp. T-0311]|nr:hypothetical protein BJV82DRAFT_94164 [Fennellomyces sp. T-0311]
MATLNKTEEEDLAKIISNLAENNERVTFQMVIDSLSDRIVSSCSDLASLEAQGPVWLQKITDVALANHVNLVRDTPSWKSIKTKIQEQDVPDSPSQPSDPYAASSAFFSPRSRLSSSELKIRIDEKEKDAIRETIKGFDKSKFWILEASIQEAALNGLPAESVLSVDEKVHKLALDSIFKHPSQSFIIDIDDPNWDDMFTTAELDEIIDFGPPVLPPVLQEVADIIAEFEQLPNALEAYNFARQLNHNPMEEPLKAWFCMTIMQTAYLFLKKDQHNIADFPETDKQYLIWGFLSSIFQGTDIWALGKEKSSVASAASANNKRKLSTTDEICRKAIGRKVDEVYICGNIELGCMEIGGSSTDQTKEIKDGRMKMPHVLKDMLLDIVTKSPTLVHKVNVTGYLISGT